jgi:transposase
MEEAMPAPGLQIRRDLSSSALRRLSRSVKDGRVSRRLLAIANALDGMSREAAARAAGMDRQTLRDWVVRYNRGGVEALHDAWGPGRPCLLSEGEQAALKTAVLAGPDPEVDGVSSWRLVDLQQLVASRYDKHYSESGLWRRLRALELSHQSARPMHAETDPAAQAAFKKTSRPGWTRSPASTRMRAGSRSGSKTKPASARRDG